MGNKKTIGERLRKLRGARSAKEVAEACNISPSAIYMYESGTRVPKDEIKLALAKYYRKSVQSIFFAT